MRNPRAAEPESAPRPQWLLHRERGSALMIWIIRSVALYLGRGPARLLSYPITLYFLFRAGPERRASLAYLSRVLGRRATYWHVARHIHTFAVTIVDRVFLLADMHDRLDVRIHNEALILACMDKGQGALLLGSHLGSFEVLRTLGVMKHSVPLKILMYEDHNRVMTRLLTELNPAIRDTVIELGRPDSLLKVHECISKGYLVGLLGDRPGGSEKLTRCRFLGEEAPLPAGPMLLASALQVPVILFFGIYRGGNRYDIYFELLADKVKLGRKRRDAEIQRWTQIYVERLEYYVRQAPYNWFNFYDFWYRDPAAGQTPAARHGTAGPSGGKPRRRGKRE